MKPQRAQRNTLCSQKEYPHKEITGKIISSAIEVHSKFGPGLLENVYEEALLLFNQVIRPDRIIYSRCESVRSELPTQLK